MILRYYPRILGVVAVLVFFTNLSLYLYSSGNLAAPPLYWIIGLGVAAAPLWLSTRALKIILQSPLALWCYGFLLISGVWMLMQPSPTEIVLEEFRTRILSVLFILTLLCIFKKEEIQVWARRATLVGVLLAVGLNVYELFSPLAFSSVTGRSAGLYINPNMSAVALILGAILTIGIVKPRMRMLFTLTVGLGVFLTFSRSAVIGWILVTIAFIKTGQISLKRSIIGGLLVLLLASVVAVWQWERLQFKLEDLGVLNQNVLTRISWLAGNDETDPSSIERKQVAELGWEMFSERPIFGRGVGASIDWSYEKSSHNEYLNMMVDHGILGFLILPLLVLAAIWRAQGEARHIAFAFGLFTLYLGFFSHNILSERHILIMFALLESMVMSSRSTRRYEEKAQDKGRSYNHCFAR